MTFPRPFGRYILLEQIGRGEMSEVFKATEPGQENRVVAIKRIKKELACREDLVKILESEAHTVSTLRHPNLIEVYDFATAEDCPYLVMEYFDSFDLSAINFAFKKSGSFIPLPHVCFILRQVAAALGYLHDQKFSKAAPAPILHTDLAARNILIGRNGAVKLIDFSVLQTEFNLSRTGSDKSWTVLGDISPEMAQGKPLTERSDIYQLGLVLYKQVIGRSPYGEKSGQELHDAIVHFDIGTHSLPENLDPELKEILFKALAKSPSDRYTSASHFEKALTDYLSRYYPSFGLEQMASYVEMAIYPSKLWPSSLQNIIKVSKKPGSPKK